MQLTALCFSSYGQVNIPPGPGPGGGWGLTEEVEDPVTRAHTRFPGPFFSPVTGWRASGDSLAPSAKSGWSLGASVAVFVEPKWRLALVVGLTSAHPFSGIPAPPSLPSQQLPTWTLLVWASPSLPSQDPAESPHTHCQGCWPPRQTWSLLF